jgi:hypothetical protein
MSVTRRRVVSVEDATAKLDILARRCGIANPRYEESEADSMSEFDALKWISLCSQRIALQESENENSSRDWPPTIIRSLYGNMCGSASTKLENTEEVHLKLAA